MVQIPINPFDNDRLKTRKVQAMLGELGVLPTADNERPTFLRGQRTAAILIDRALAHLAPAPPLRRCSNLQDTANTANAKFTAAYLVDDGGAGLPAGAIAYADFKNGTYFYGGNALSDFLVQNEDWGTFDPASIVPGTGYVAPGANEGPVLAPALTSTLIAAQGFTATVDLIPGVSSGGTNNLQIIMVDFPGFAQQITAELSDSATASASYVGDYNGQTNIDILSVDVLHRVAVTLSATHLAASVDGGIVATYAVADPFICNFIAFNVADGTWERMVIYPIKTDAELSALSALT